MSAPGAVLSAVAPSAGQVGERYRERGWWRDETFLDDLRRNARERPHALAVAGRRVAGSRTDTLDWAELDVLAERFAGALLRLGVHRGDVVAVQLPNRWELPALIFACLRAGAVICPISPICPAGELRHRFVATGARVVVTVPEWDGEPLADIAVGLRDELPTLEHVVVVDGPLPAGAESFHDRFVAVAWEVEAAAELAGRAPLHAEEPFVALFTSGTTGPSKGVVHSQNTVHAALRGYADAYGLGPDWVAAITTPLVHYSGFAQGVLTGALVGGTIAFQDVRRNEVLPDLVERYGATLLYGPPATVADVCEAQRAVPRDVSTLRHVVIGSGPVLPELAADVAASLGARAYSLWGMSEAGPVTMTRPVDAPERVAQGNGAPIAAMEVRLDTATTDDTSGVGRLEIRGAALALTYHGRPDAFDALLDPDGWFDTGDLARPDGFGGIRIVGRARDAIVRDGEVAPLVELEAVAGSHPDTREAAVVEVEGAAGREIVAVLVPRATSTPSLEELRERLLAAGHEQRFLPDRVEVVVALPKTLTGKVRKADLRARFSV